MGNKCLSDLGLITTHMIALDEIELVLSLLIRWEEAELLKNYIVPFMTALNCVSCKSTLAYFCTWSLQSLRGGEFCPHRLCSGDGGCADTVCPFPYCTAPVQ